MTAFTFLHAADLHLASPMSGLAGKDAAVAARFAQASRDAFSDLVSHALKERVAFVLLAGDVFDGSWTDLSVGLFFARELARLAREGIPVALVRGNHDAESVVRKHVTLPEAVLEFPSRTAATHRLGELGVAIHGRSFPERAVPDDFVRGYPAPAPGLFNVGLLHTSCGGYGEHEAYAPCSPADLAAMGYDYWALGHVHEHQVLSREPFIVYPGNLQGRSVKECGPKGAVAVDVVDGRVVDLRRVTFDRARWAHVEATVAADDDEAAVLASVASALRTHVEAADGRLVAFRVTLRGATALHHGLAGERERIAGEIQAAAHRLHEDAWLEELKVRTTGPALDRPAPAFGHDLVAALGVVGRDPALRAEAAAILDEVGGRLRGLDPDGEAPLPELLDELLAEAEAVVASRLSGRAA